MTKNIVPKPLRFCFIALVCIFASLHSYFFASLHSYVYLLRCIVFIFASLHGICVILLYCIFVLFYIALLLSSLLLFISQFLTLSSAFYIFLSATRTQEVDSTNYSQNKQPKCLSSVAGPEKKQTNSNMTIFVLNTSAYKQL